jgi:hypothetical protein
MRHNYKTEFPCFDFVIPQLPDGFIDTSWHNDVSPKFERKYNETHSVVFWVDYLDESRRECGGRQLTVLIQLTDDDGVGSYIEPEYVIETDSWDEAINAINQLFNEAKQ